VLTINGSGFGPTQGNSFVSFFSYITHSWTTWAGVKEWSDTQITVTVPIMPIGKVNLNVTVGAFNSIGVIAFTVGTPPLIASTTPGFGVPGTDVTINGSGFGAVQSDSSVWVLSSPSNRSTLWGAVKEWTDTQITVTVPSNTPPGKVYVNVNVNGLDSLGVVPYTVGTPPLVSSTNPAFGIPGTDVTINGFGFGTSQNNSYVSVLAAETNTSMQWPIVKTWNDTQVTVTVPSNTPRGKLYVNVNVHGLDSLGVVTYIVGIPPAILSYTPQFGPPGTDVTIKGAGFGASQGDSYVSVVTPTNVWTQWPNVREWSDTQIIVTVPSNMPFGKVYLVVEVDELSSLGWHPYTVGTPPLVASITPAFGIPGSDVTINGSNFGTAQNDSYVSVSSSVSKASIRWAEVKEWSDARITVTVPSNMPLGKVYVNVAVGALDSLGVVPFTVGNPALVFSTAPLFGIPGTDVTVNGSGFGLTQGNSFVSVSSPPTNSWTKWVGIKHWSNTEIIVTVPPDMPLGVVYLNVTVGGLTSLGVVAYTVGTPPIVASSAPAFGLPGTDVTIDGSGFGTGQDGGFVWVLSASTHAWTMWPGVKQWTETQIIVTVPDNMPFGMVYLNVAARGLNSIGVLPYTIVKEIQTHTQDSRIDLHRVREITFPLTKLAESAVSNWINAAQPTKTA
jgi:hypothetical protein